MQRYLLLIVLLIGFTFTALAQQPAMPLKKSKADSLQERKDSLRSKPFVPKISGETVYHPDSNHSPHKAVIHSLIIPGWGQVYNHKWWKVPLIYGVLGSLGVLYIKNQNYYTEDLAIAKYREKGTQPAKGDAHYDLYQTYALYRYSDQAVYDEVRADRRNRDLTIFGFVLAWGVQSIEAYVDAKFMHSYSMDTNFSFKVVPSLINQPMYASNFNGSLIPGLKITFTLR